MLAACGAPGERPDPARPLLVRREDRRESAVGIPDALQGVVSNRRIPTLVGVEADAGDLQGMTGWLRKRVVTQEERDRGGGVFAHAGPGAHSFPEDAGGRRARGRPAP